jgi:hypothetical protein
MQVKLRNQLLAIAKLLASGALAALLVASACAVWLPLPHTKAYLLRARPGAAVTWFEGSKWTYERAPGLNKQIERSGVSIADQCIDDINAAVEPEWLDGYASDTS